MHISNPTSSACLEDHVQTTCTGPWCRFGADCPFCKASPLLSTSQAQGCLLPRPHHRGIQHRCCHVQNEAVQTSVVASFLQASPFMNPINLLAFCCTSAACWFLLKCSFPPFLLTQHQCPPIGTDTRTVPNYHANNFLGEPHIHVSKLWLLWKRIQPFHVTCPSHIHPNAFILMRIFSLYCPWVFACIVSVSKQVNFRTDNFLP